MSDMVGKRKTGGEAEVASDRRDCAASDPKVQCDESFGRDGCAKILHRREVRMVRQTAAAPTPMAIGGQRV